MCLNFKSRLEGLLYGEYENDGVKNGTKVRTYETLVNFWNFKTGIKPQSSQNWASLRWILQILTTCEIRIILYRFNISRGYRISNKISCCVVTRVIWKDSLRTSSFYISEIVRLREVLWNSPKSMWKEILTCNRILMIFFYLIRKVGHCKKLARDQF